jgi:glucose-1-phosphate thymidylyltransferase
MKNKINLTGVILCAGKGTRIKKMPFSQPKTLLEILGLPIIYYQLRYLKNIGVKKVFIVCGKNKSDISKKIKIMPDLKLNIQFVKDLKPQGIASSLFKIKKYIKGPILVFLGDIFLRDVKLQKMVNKFVNSDCSCILAAIKEKNKHKLKKNFTIELGRNSKVKKVIEKPKKPETDIKGVGIYLFSKNIFNAISKTSINFTYRRELGITEAIQTLIDMGNKVFSSLCVKEDVNINEPLDFWDTNFKQLKKTRKKNFISKNVMIGKNVSIMNSIIGPRVKIGSNSIIKNSIIFSDVRLKEKTYLIKSIKTNEGYLRLK